MNHFRKIIVSSDTNLVRVLMLLLLPLTITLTFTLIEQQATAVVIALLLTAIQWGMFVTTQQKLAQSNQLQAEHTRTKLELHNRETKLSAVFKLALDGMVQIENGVITAANPAFAAMLGYPVAEIIGKPLAQFIIPRDRDLIGNAIAALVRGEAIPFIYEIAVLYHDEVEFPIEMTLGVIQNTASATVLAIVRGMSIRKQAAQNIQKLNSELQQQAAHLTVLNQIGQAVSSLTDLKSVLRNALEQFKSIMPLDVFFVILHDTDEPLKGFPIMYDSGQFWDSDVLILPLDPSSLTGIVVRTGEPLLINRTAEEIGAPGESMIGDRKRVSASLLMAPLKVGERIIGAISIQSYTLNAYDERHCSLLMGAAYHIAVAVENARLYEALQKELAERKHAEEMVRQLNAELEQRVIQRTAELESANQELEAFSYSVSHDLRSPLRALHGFANILAEDLGDTVSAEVQHYLNRIQYNAQRMGYLIDDLLALSRVGRAELRLTTVDMNGLVQQVLTEMRNDNSLNGTTVIVADLPPCRGDNGLLKLVWVNLIENAVKYSHKREQPHIEIRTKQNFYVIQDNGTGFDMQYLDKLFGVFQRLHPADSYEGTGIGLATVKRIITRHGGEIRAEAELDKGATFYFSIGEAN